MKNDIGIWILLLIIISTFCLISYYFIYLKRKVLFSLSLLFALGLMIILAINTESLIFNDISVGVEMC